MAVKKTLILAILAALFFSVFPIYAQEISGDESVTVYKKIFSIKPAGLEISKIFDQKFLKAVSEDKIKQLLIELAPKLGEFKSAVKTSAGSYNLLFSKGRMPSKMSLGPSGLITGLWFGSPVLSNDDLEKISAEFKALEGSVSVSIIKNGSEAVFLLNPDYALGVGSSFKLYVLMALDEKIKSGGCDDKTVIEISKRNFSLPSGLLQGWPDKSPLTLRSLANLMISMSDNTATDALIDFLGRDSVEKCSPERVRPFLKTQEMFKIKWGISSKERDEYVAADTGARRKLLEKLAGFDLSKVRIGLSAPTLISQIEWHITSRELCDAIYRLKQDSSLTINSGLADASLWNHAGYKGGSEPGVLNYTHILQKKSGGNFYAVSATINNETAEVQTEKFTELIARTISLVEDEKFAKSK